MFNRFFRNYCNTLHFQGSVILEDDEDGLSHAQDIRGTGDVARTRVRDYFNDLRETVNKQEEAGLAVIDSYIRDQLSWFRQRQEDMVSLISRASAVCSHCEKTLKTDDAKVVPYSYYYYFFYFFIIILR